MTISEHPSSTNQNNNHSEIFTKSLKTMSSTTATADVDIPSHSTTSSSTTNDNSNSNSSPVLVATNPSSPSSSSTTTTTPNKILTRTASLSSFFKSKKRSASPNPQSSPLININSSNNDSNNNNNSFSESLRGKKRKRRSLFAFIGNNNNNNNNHDTTTHATSNSSIQSSNESEIDDEEEEDNYENDHNTNGSKLMPHHSSKKLKTRELTAEELKKEEEKIAFEKRERELDEELEPQYRKFRPSGYKFNPPPLDRPVRIYADGVFDLFHLGHMRQLEQAKKALPNATLICGVPSDEETHRKKGLTVLTDKQRCDTLIHCKWVDEVIPNSPWCVTPEFLEQHNIDYVAHDDLPYASGDSDDIYRPIKELGKFLTTQRTEGISTSDIITKIIRDYDKYLMRNFARGASRQELNVSWLKKNELDLKRHVKEFRESFKTKYENASKDLYSEIRAYIVSTLGNVNNKSKKKSISLGSAIASAKKPRVIKSSSSLSGEGDDNDNAVEEEASKKQLHKKEKGKSVTNNNNNSTSSAGEEEEEEEDSEDQEEDLEEDSEDDNDGDSEEDLDSEFEDELGQKRRRRSRSPVTEFVNGYTGNSVVGTVKGWLSRKSSAPNSPPQSSSSSSS